MDRTISIASATFVVLFASACGGAPPMPPMRETQRVAIAGQQADTIGETVDGPIEGHMLVRTNDGREVWVREGNLSEPQIAADAWVLVAHAGGIVPAQVVRTLDDYIEVRVGAVVGIAPMHTIFAILHSAPSVPVTDAFSTTAPTDPSTAATATH
jgi:hypothetical protein